MYDSFIAMIKRSGRSCELELMTKYYLKTNPFAAIKMIPIGLKLLTRRRMPLRGEKIKGIKELRIIIDKAYALGGGK
jgi:heterodisulfide reductase subunit C/quinone-modifying oxidoreductase subunit QmoC